jgi:hypothetical protein
MLINQDGGTVGCRKPVSDSNTKSIQSAVGCVERPDGKPLPPPGPACEQELFARHGRPFMFPVREGIAFGVSSAPDNSSSLYLWADNQTGEAVTLSFCCISTLFDHIEIFDSEGHRVLSKSDQVAQKARSERRDLVQVCSCSGISSVPVHTMQLFVPADMSEGYSLQRGRYIVSERNPSATHNLTSDENEPIPHPPPGLAISIP